MKLRVWRRIRILAVCLACLSLLLGMPVTQAAGGDRQPACSVDHLSALENMDFSRLKAVTREGPYPETTQGATISHLYAFDALKAMDATFYGETGKMDVKYYFLSRNSYLIDIVDYDYTNFIYEPDWEVKSETHYRYFFCDGALIESSGDPRNEIYDQRFDGMLEELLTAVPKGDP